MDLAEVMEKKLMASTLLLLIETTTDKELQVLSKYRHLSLNTRLINFNINEL